MNSLDVPPHAMFRVLIRWGRFVFEPHAAPTTASSFQNQQSYFMLTQSDKGARTESSSNNNNNSSNEQDMISIKKPQFSAVEQTTGTEYRLVWFRAIDGVAIGHTKWCCLTLLHSVVSVVDFQSAPAVVDIVSGYMANAATRVILLQLQQRSIDPTLEVARATSRRGGGDFLQQKRATAPPVVAATGAIDAGMFVGSPPRSYIVTLEASFFAVGKLHMNLVVKEPKLDLDSLGADEKNLPFGQQSSPAALVVQQQQQQQQQQQRQAILKRNQRRNLERLTVLVVDSIESERAGGGGVSKVGVYGIARLLQDSATDDRRFPLPAESAYQLKISFVTDPKYVAKPMLARNVSVNAAVVASTKNQQQQQLHQGTDASGSPASQALFADSDNRVHNFDSSFASSSSNIAKFNPSAFVDGSHDDKNHYNGGANERRVVTFRTQLQQPRDGRVLWRCGIALSPCTKVKFALYRDQTRIGSAAIMSSQLAVASMPHDFCLPIKVRLSTGANAMQLHALQINLTLAEHTLDTVSREVISSYLRGKDYDNDDESGNALTSSTTTGGHVCMVPGSDLMVLMRGYEVREEERNFDLYLKNHPEATPFSKDDDDVDEDDDDDECDDENENDDATKKRKNKTSEAKRRGLSPKILAVSTTIGTNTSPNFNSRVGLEEQRFSAVAPVVVPEDLKSIIDPKQTGGFVSRSSAPPPPPRFDDGDEFNNGAAAALLLQPIQTENTRLSAENEALRQALQEQEERIRDQESYILTLLENQGVIAVDDDDDDDDNGVVGEGDYDESR